MLTIKKQNPYKKLYYYGAGAFVVGYALTITALAHANVNLDKFAVVTPSAQTQMTTEPSPTTSEDTGDQAKNSPESKTSASAQSARSESQWQTPSATTAQSTQAQSNSQQSSETGSAPTSTTDQPTTGSSTTDTQAPDTDSDTGVPVVAPILDALIPS